MRLLVLLVLVVARGADAGPAPLAEAERLLRAAGVTDAWMARRARPSPKVTEARLRGVLERLLAPCLTRRGSCKKIVAGTSPTSRAAESLVALLGEHGTAGSLPLLSRLETRGLTAAVLARERLLTRAMEAGLPRHSCAPPTPAEVATARRALAGFLVVRRLGTKLVARRPTKAELDDLAYFLAAVRDAGPEVGRSAESTQGSWARPGRPNPQRKALVERFERARARGQLREMAQVGRRYLATLGYPGKLRMHEVGEYAWGGARASYVMRDLARTLESLGELAEAAALYRRTPPGGGACGTSTSSHWRDQVKGVIRTEELQGHCRRVVPERLLDLEASEPVYGPQRLKTTGFDLPRLYRGALVTLNRDLKPDQLKATLAQAPAPLRAAALKRLAQQGPEAWERRVRAIEGLADLGQRAALPELVRVIGRAQGPARVRALEALGRLARRPPSDPCAKGQRSFGLAGISDWRRPIRSLGRACKTRLGPKEAAALARQLLPQVKDQSPAVRQAAAQALGRIGAPVADPALRRLLRDPHGPTGERCETPPGGKERCRPLYPVREAAREALTRLASPKTGHFFDAD